MPTLYIDIIIRDWEGKYFLVKNNNPLKEEWWILSRKLEDKETFATAGLRLIYESTGIDIPPPEARILIPLGYYEDFSPKDIHIVSIVFMAGNSLLSPDYFNTKLNDDEWKWSWELPYKLKHRLAHKKFI